MYDPDKLLSIFCVRKLAEALVELAQFFLERCDIVAHRSFLGGMPPLRFNHADSLGKLLSAKPV